jgi:uncharacterized alkaline shock family protein YloU
MTNYFLIENFTNNGALGISYQVFEEIAKICVSEVEGATLSSNEGLFKLNRPVLCNIQSDGIEITVNVKIDTGLNVNDVCLKVQEKVQDSIYDMTEIKPKKIDIKVTGVK